MKVKTLFGTAALLAFVAACSAGTPEPVSSSAGAPSASSVDEWRDARWDAYVASGADVMTSEGACAASEQLTEGQVSRMVADRLGAPWDELSGVDKESVRSVKNDLYLAGCPRRADPS